MTDPTLIPRFNLDYHIRDLILNVFPINCFNGHAQLKQMFGNVYFTNSGRAALYLILRSLVIPKGSKIGVPLYSCSVVFDAIIKAGFIPEFIDIDLENYTINPLDLEKKIDNLKAVIIIHTFGRPADMDRIKNVAGNIPIIEDCAHSLFSVHKGEMTGKLGTASFFSFKKYPSAGEGGMIILNDSSFEDNLKKEICGLSSASKINEIKHAFLTYAHSFLYHRPWYGVISFPIGSRLLKKNENIGDFEVKLIRKGDMAVFLRKIRNIKNKIERQRHLSKMLIKELQDTSLVLPYEIKGTRCNYFLFPIRMKNKETRDKLHLNLRKCGIDSAKLYSEAPLIAKKFYGYDGTCPNAEMLSDTILTIPNYYTLSDSDLLEIATKLYKIEGTL